MKQKWTKGRKILLVVWLALILLITAAIVVVSLTGGPPGEEGESIREVMRDGVLHELNKVWFFGLEVNPAVVSAYLVTGVLLIAALLIRIIAVPRFRTVPGKFQAVLEKAVGFFSDMAKGNSPHKTGFVAAYIFSAGLYIFFSTLFELFGIREDEESDSATVSGWVMEQMGRLPMAGDTFIFEDLKVTVVKTSGRRPALIRVVVRSEDPEI